ncbi:nucleosomal histone kinase 1 [Lucilia cuprina]|uniref:nucleosomal histone kinase 1 n=1 Tax=Lucilia cuprina TaxID=7375 RepID=UPI001F0692F7|nr:nucleosomal histone kinase 1 [Lucilia cuprina]
MPKVAAKRNVAGGATGGGAKKAAAGAKKSKLYSMPEKIKEGTILRDLMKTEWKIGPSIGTGGFGEIYSASKKAENKYDYVVKCEPHDNGPLFVEMHFYMRNARFDDINKFQKEHGLKSLGMPYMIGNGSAEINGIKHRFIVMPRYGSDVAKHFLANGRRLPEATCYRLALQMLDVYEFIHGCGYVHADLKAANILLGYGKQQQHQAYLVDFGLASHYTTKDFKPDPKKMHNGTIEYTSRDAHLGVPTMRADLEILGYNLIEWLGADLPWVKDKILTTPVKVQKAKENFMSDVGTNLKKLFAKGAPSALVDFFKYVAKMEYNDTPDYEKCRKMFTSALKTLKMPLSGDLEFKLKGDSKISSPSTSKPIKVSAAKKRIKKEILDSEQESDEDSVDEIINASDDDDDDVVYLNNKKPLKKETKKPLKTAVKLTPKQRVLANNSLKRRSKNESSNSESSPSPSKRSRLNNTKSPIRTKHTPLKLNSPLKTTSLTSSSATKTRHTPLNAKTNIRMSPAITMSSTRSGKTVINDRVTPNRKPAKTYEFNFELDVSMDANVIVNVKRKKKPLQPSQEIQDNSSSSRNTPSGKHTTSNLSNSTPVTRVKVRKVGSGDDGSDSPRTPAVTVKKSRRIQNTPS